MLLDDKYYAVTMKTGHVSRCFYIPITFGIIAENKKEAVKIAKRIPRVKRNHKDCVLGIREITKDEYLLINLKNNNDPFLKCKSKHEQNGLDLNDRLVEDPHYKEINKKIKKEKQKHSVYYKKDKISNPKKYARSNNDYMEDFMYEGESNFCSGPWKEYIYY